MSVGVATCIYHIVRRCNHRDWGNGNDNPLSPSSCRQQGVKIILRGVKTNLPRSFLILSCISSSLSCRGEDIILRVRACVCACVWSINIIER